MRMYDNLVDIYDKLISDEGLLRLLHYKPAKFSDDPFSPTKKDILSSDERWKITDRVIVRSAKTNDLAEDSSICRLCVYPGLRDNSVTNYLIADQAIVFDIYVHIASFDAIDFRLAKICDYLDSAFFNKAVTGMGKVRFGAGKNIPNPPKGYLGYRLFYEFGSGKG